MQLTLKQMNAEIQKVAPNVELVRGNGYLYYVYDDKGANFETDSVMVPYLYMRRCTTWIADGMAYSKKIEAKIAERGEDVREGPIRCGVWVR